MKPKPANPTKRKRGRPEVRVLKIDATEHMAKCLEMPIKELK